jgi:hypothetical protein
MSRSRLLWLFGAAVFLSACNSAPDRAPAIGEAFAGPASLPLHQDIDLKSPAVTTAHHGDRLEIVGQRRRWYKVRSAKGIEGWTSDRELLDTAQMDRLRALSAETAGQPSQGVATTFGAINVHTEPNRQSTSFLQVKEHEKFDVIAHRVAERAPLPRRQLVPPRPKIQNAKKEKTSSGVAPPPELPAPAPPRDWIEISKERAAPPDEDDDAHHAPTDDWTLIRTADGQGGWVLTSAIYLQIPDEVAQYAEGHRITSYFSIGKIRDGAEQKDIWLWTTAEKLGEPYDFDGYRVFTWSLRRHRYETAYIQRREQGYFPVIAKEGEFSVCLAKDDGTMVRRQYVMMGNAVRPAGTMPCEKSAPIADDAPQELVTAPAAPSKSFAQRAKDRLKSLFARK